MSVRLTPEETEKEKETEFYILIHESKGYVEPFRADYRIGPYKTYEEADDMYFVACFHSKSEYDSEGNSIYWDHEIEEIETNEPNRKCFDETCACN